MAAECHRKKRRKKPRILDPALNVTYLGVLVDQWFTIEILKQDW